ncbi:hypothetical protein G6F68_020111 [Rhizopus microsporus]|nr:hypothetical protein G6F68_020111 [Rhizopus microsporus]
MFATHNAHTIAAVRSIANGGVYEHQKLHGMGDDLPAAIPGAPPAGKRRQLQLRQPHHRRTRADRRPDPRSGRDGRLVRLDPPPEDPAAG